MVVIIFAKIFTAYDAKDVLCAVSGLGDLLRRTQQALSVTHPLAYIWWANFGKIES